MARDTIKGLKLQNAYIKERADRLQAELDMHKAVMSEIARMQDAIMAAVAEEYGTDIDGGKVVSFPVPVVGSHRVMVEQYEGRYIVQALSVAD